MRSEEHTSELQSPCNLVCRLLLEKKKNDTSVQGRRRSDRGRPAVRPGGSRRVLLRVLSRGDPCRWSSRFVYFLSFFFFFNDTATTEIYTLSLHDALPISPRCSPPWSAPAARDICRRWPRSEEHTSELQSPCNLVCRLLLEKKKKKEK